MHACLRLPLEMLGSCSTTRTTAHRRRRREAQGACAYAHTQAVEDVAASGRCCILDIDVQGARLVRASKLKAIFVFVAPPSTEELERRLRGRGTESDEQVALRMKAAKAEIARWAGGHR